MEAPTNLLIISDDFSLYESVKKSPMDVNVFFARSRTTTSISSATTPSGSSSPGRPTSSPSPTNATSSATSCAG